MSQVLFTSMDVDLSMHISITEEFHYKNIRKILDS